MTARAGHGSKAVSPPLALVAGISCVAPSHAQEIEDQLRLLAPLVGETWIGRFVQPEGAPSLRLTWEAALDGHAIRLTKEAPGVDLIAETLYYWDRAENALRFLSLSNRGVVSRGAVTVEDGLIVHVGLQVDRAMVTEYKQTLELLVDGRLRDIFCARTPAGWWQRHLIFHERIPADPS